MIPEALAETCALFMMRHWYLHPDFSSVGMYEGVHLGECAEYVLFQDLVRIFRFKLQMNPEMISDILPFQRPTETSLMKARQTRLISFQKGGSHTSRISQPSERPTVLLCVRTQNLAIADALQASQAFDLIIEGNREAISDSLKRAGVQHENFDDFVTPDIRSTCETEFAERLPLWIKALESPSFREEFSLWEKDLCPDIRDRLMRVFQKEFSQEMITIKTLRHLVGKRNVVLVLVWNDSLPPHRALTLGAQGMGVPVLHVSHAIHGMDPTNEVVYADRVAVCGNYSRDAYISRGNPSGKIVVTGNPDWDKYRVLPKMWQRDTICRSLGLDTRKRTVLFATFHLGVPYGPKDATLPERFYRCLLRSIRELNRCHSIQLAVKLHPVERDRQPWYQRIAMEEGLENVVIQSACLEKLLFVSDVVVCRGSNIGFEALLLGKPVISHGMTLYGEEKAAIVTNSDSELKAAIEKSLFDPHVRRELDKNGRDAAYRFNHLDDGKATHRVMNLIEKMTGMRVKIPQSFVSFPRSVSENGSKKPPPRRKGPEAYLEEGDLAVARDEIEEALDLYRKAQERYPLSSAVLRRLGRTLLRAGQIGEATRNLTRLIEIDPRCVEGHLLLALACYSEKKHAVALNHLSAVLDLQSSTQEERRLAHLHAARCKNAMGDPEGSERCYQRSLMLDPDFRETLRELGALYFGSGKLDMARKTFERMIARHPEDTEAHNDLGVVLFRMGRPDEGKSYLRKALEITPGCFDAIVNLAEIEITEGHHERAVNFLEDYLSEYPDSQEVRRMHDRIKHGRTVNQAVQNSSKT